MFSQHVSTIIIAEQENVVNRSKDEVLFSCYKCFTDEQALLEHIPKHKESKHLKIYLTPFFDFPFITFLLFLPKSNLQQDSIKENAPANYVVLKRVPFAVDYPKRVS
ncbi:unnamed protein product [Onchocerca flexuosa]|uniref:C2H2-type domain-containing protein n=1 Tax=Onchocerca flexuosa TaxID=387005 RepID=A0A183HMX2_9BILA|nr:unnamed protein product [Onchocerca flexuosa]